MADDQEIGSRDQLAQNLRLINERIVSAADRSGRQADDITLVAVSKTFPADLTALAVEAGVTDLGESRVKDGSAKIAELGPIAKWHMIGHLQSNKAKRAVEYFDMIHSLDSYELAQKVSGASVALEKRIDCLIELNSSGELAKYGYRFDQLLSEAEKISKLPGVNLCGLMTIGPLTRETEAIKKAFEKTNDMFEAMKQNLGEQVQFLSMGMSHDFEIAIACGSNMVRIGTAIFGRRG